MIKKYILVVLIVVGFVVTFYKTARYIDKLYDYKKLYYLELQSVDSMSKVIMLKDSIFIINANKINELQKNNDTIYKEFKRTINKYNALENMYIKIKAQRDSVINLNFDIIKDTVVSNKYNFNTMFDLFSISGSYGCNPQFINAVLRQEKPLVLNVGVYNKQNKYYAIIKSNSKLLQFDWAYVNFYEPEGNVWSNIEISVGMPVNRFGVIGGVYYNDFGIQYTKFVNDYNLAIMYKTSVIKLWRMIRE